MRQSTSIDTSEKELAAIRQELCELLPMRQELNELRQADAAMRGKLNELLAAMRGSGNGPGSCQSDSKPFLQTAETSTLTDRRGMFKKVASLAGGVAIAGLLRPYASKAANLETPDSTTAGALTLLAGPKRLVDTRAGSGFADEGRQYGASTLRVYNIVTLAAGQIPMGAKAIVGLVTALNSSAAGAIQESPNPPVSGNDLGPGTGIVHFSAGQIIRNTFISALDANGQIRVSSAIASGTVDVIIDTVGYFI